MSLNKLKIFRSSLDIIGMIHVRPLPGSAKYDGNFKNILKTACLEAEIYKNSNVDGVMVENMHDAPYVLAKNLGPETVAAMTRICTAVREIMPKSMYCGLQILAGGNKESLAVAQASGFNFIRAEGFVFGHLADEGYIDACAGPLLRYRSFIKADNISIFTDIKKKHSSHAITADVTVEDTAKAAEFFESDGVIITGAATGQSADVKELKAVKKSSKIPVIIGSGITIENFRDYEFADAFIIGSYFKHENRWNNPIDCTKVENFMNEVRKLREEAS